MTSPNRDASPPPPDGWGLGMVVGGWVLAVAGGILSMLALGLGDTAAMIVLGLAVLSSGTLFVTGSLRLARNLQWPAAVGVAGGVVQVLALLAAALAWVAVLAIAGSPYK